MSPSLLLKIFSIISAITLSHSNSQCLDDQKILLLQLKNELVYNSSISTKLVQWNQTNDCCNWYGVECDVAGNVISLQLDHETVSGGIEDSSSLFKLKYLEKLNLAFNKLNSTQIPRGIHNLTYLTHLNLSNAVFSGQVPAEISSLTRLLSLDLSNNYTVQEFVSLEYPNLKMLLQNLTELRELYLDSAFISYDESKKWSHIIASYLPNLTALSMRYCSLYGPFARSFGQLHSLSILRLDYNNLFTTVPDWFANFSSLSTLSLVYCRLNGSFPNMIFHIPTLENLDLSTNNLGGSIPPFTQNGSLKSIVLSGTLFSGSIPKSVSNLKALSKMDLSFCQFTGSIPSTFANLTQLVYVDLSYNSFTGSLSPTLFDGLSNLVYLDLGDNSFSGNIPHSLFRLPSLSKLHLTNNQLTGLVEEFHIVNVSNIVNLDLSSNRLEGPIPNSLFQLNSLESLLLSENLFSGTFQLDKIQSLSNLAQLDLSRNNLSVDVGDENSRTYRLPLLKLLHLASCNMHDYPHVIKHSDLKVLDLSNNHIVGEIPSWIWGTQLRKLNLSLNLLTDVQKPYHIPASLEFLDLHSNQLRGDLNLLIPPGIENLTSELWFLSLANNSLSGSIPTSLCTARKLTVLDLSLNILSGSIPSCLLDDTLTLNVFDLGRNNIRGHIPDNFSLYCSLQYFDLSNNILEGKIPRSLESCESLQFMNVGNNIISDSFPCMLSSSLLVLVLHSNKLHGEVRCQKSWPNLQIVDLSSNGFSGSLGSINFTSWEAMVTGSDAQLRHSHSYSDFLKVTDYFTGGVRITMKGLEVELVKIWPDFTAIDLSCNNFGGEIPNTISDLRSLHLLNLSHNALNGSITNSFGKLRDLESLDLSVNELTGSIPEELVELTFLSFLNLSYNKLVGKIPSGRQLQTFSTDSFKGNAGLCGSILNISCSNTNDRNLSPAEDEHVEEKRKIEWGYVFAALGYVVGLGSILWLVFFCRSFRKKYLDKIDEVVEEILDAGDMRRRRHASARRRVVRNQVVRRR